MVPHARRARRGRPRAPRGRGAQDLALLRDVRGPGGPRPAAGQLPGDTRAPGRPPHVAHEHRHGSARDPGRPRSRLHRTRTSSPTRIDATLTTIEGLERHEGHLLNWYDTQTPGAASAGLRVHRRQRQPGGRAHDPGRGAADGGAEAAMLRRDPPHGCSARACSTCAAAAAFADGMNFRFLYDPQRRIFSIGYRLADAGGARAPGRLLLRPAGLGGAPGELHRHRQGRRPRDALVPPGTAGHQRATDAPTLLSWSATLFEYLMPLLVMRSYPDTLLDQTCRMVVRRQIEYGDASAACPGASRSRPTTSSTGTTTTSTRPSASPASA